VYFPVLKWFAIFSACLLLLAFQALSMHTIAKAPPSAPVPSMSNLKSVVPKADGPFPAGSRRVTPQDRKQRQLMLGSLFLLLTALSIVIWHNRDFWFPDTENAESDQPAVSSPASKVSMLSPAPAAKTSSSAKPKHQAAPQVHAPATPIPTPPVEAATTTRTVLPPLEVEVVAGDSHRTIRPGSDSVRLDLQPNLPPQPITEPTVAADTQTAATVTSTAAEHVQMTTATSDVLTHPVKPNYPLLARQMKVQGSVILQALIGKDGIIQNLRVVSGPHILASAAEDAVRQWHFRPHFEGTEAVETQAKITVNFTISTN
jgi:protein TonB